jgi:hypothetical protein
MQLRRDSHGLSQLDAAYGIRFVCALGACVFRT